MSSWTQNDLQSGQNSSNQAPADVAVTEPPLGMRITIEETARMVSWLKVSKSSSEIEERDLNLLGLDFGFLSSSHPFHAFYQRKLIEVGAEEEGESPHFYPELHRPYIRYPAEITLKELGIMKLTAQFLVRYGTSFEDKLMGINPLFGFLKPYHKWMGLWDGLVTAYTRVLTRSKRKSDAYVLDCFLDRLQLDKLQKGDETALVDLHAFVTGVDSFAHMVDVDYSEITITPADLSAMMKQMMQLTECRQAVPIHPDPPATHEFVGVLEPRKSSFTIPAGITLQELGIIKLTAQFVARFGTDFCGDLMKRVAMSPHFEFMKPTDIRIGFFNRLVAAYTRVLRHSVSESDAEADACIATALECFFQRLQLEKLEEGEEMAVAIIDLHTFVSGLDCFALMEDEDYSAIMPQPAHLSTMLNLPTQIQGSQVKAPPLPLPEEPEPKA